MTGAGSQGCKTYARTVKVGVPDCYKDMRPSFELARLSRKFTFYLKLRVAREMV
jgi:hypothetical protein